MDNMAYLQQISASSKPNAKSKFNFKLNPKILLFVGIGIALIIFIAIISSILNRQDTKDQDLTVQDRVRITNLMTTIETYNPYVKSSSLRAMGSSLSVILAETDREITSIIVNDFGIKTNDIKKLPIATGEEAAHYADLVNTLEEARISGLLDRVYAREFTLQIALLMSIQSEIIERTERQNLKEPLEKSNTDLQSLYTQFSDYSDFAN